MKCRSLMLGLLSILSAHAAKATVLYDTLNVGSAANANYDGSSNGNSLMAGSFTVNGTPALTVTLALSADRPSDGGSVMVYLVPDDGNGTGVGFAADPITNTDAGSGNSVSYDSASRLLQTISDRSLATTDAGPASVKVAISSATMSAVRGASANQEYWLGLALSSDSSANWWQNSDGSGSGTQGQSDFSSTSGSAGYSLAGGAYEMTVTTPEPTTMAILSGGLACLGCVRRQRAKRAAR